MTNRIRKKMLLFNIGIPTENNDNSNLMITNLIEFNHAFFDYIMPSESSSYIEKSIA